MIFIILLFSWFRPTSKFEFACITSECCFACSSVVSAIRLSNDSFMAVLVDMSRLNESTCPLMVVLLMVVLLPSSVAPPSSVSAPSVGGSFSSLAFLSFLLLELLLLPPCEPAFGSLLEGLLLIVFR